MYLFFEKGLRGGVSYISKRYSKANNKYLKFHDPKQESKYVIYLDVDNLYGYAKRNTLCIRIQSITIVVTISRI